MCSSVQFGPMVATQAASLNLVTNPFKTGNFSTLKSSKFGLVLPRLTDKAGVTPSMPWCGLWVLYSEYDSFLELKNFATH